MNRENIENKEDYNEKLLQEKMKEIQGLKLPGQYAKRYIWQEMGIVVVLDKTKK